MSRTLTIQAGSTADLEVRLFDPDGAAEDLTGADAAHLTVRTVIDDETSEKLVRSTAAANLSIDVAGGKLVATLTQEEADGLPDGAFVGQASVRIGGTWFVTREFTVRIHPKGVATS